MLIKGSKVHADPETRDGQLIIGRLRQHNVNSGAILTVLSTDKDVEVLLPSAGSLRVSEEALTPAC